MNTTLLLEQHEMARMLERLASQIMERHAKCDHVMLVGIERRGADIARRLSALLEERLGHPVLLGTLDINLYRDDWTSLEGKPHIGQSRIPASVDGRVIILVDDVLYTGRTIRAAWRLCWTTDAPWRWNCWPSLTGGAASCPSTRIMWAARSIPAAMSALTCCWLSGTGRTPYT